ncbi:hypothetical protein WG947_07275 [Pontibacter sp. H259]|uniref:hypothetical protein n=1 Tax=Pontibacter sp. H259 TaxID=3133421 RepID=UPI0030C48C9B
MKAFVFLLNCYLFVSTVLAQEKDYNMYTDFHIHIGFKNYNRNIKVSDEILQYRNDGLTINRLHGESNWISFGYYSPSKTNGEVSTLKNYNQSDFTELKNANGSILVNSIYPYEKSFTKNAILRTQVSRISGIDKKRLKNIASNKNSPFKEFLAEYYFTINQTLKKGATEFSFPKNKADLLSNINDGKISILFSIEGGHSLHGLYTSQKNYVRKMDCNSMCQDEIINSIKELKNLPHRIFFITPAHFSWNKIVGNAKSLDRDEERAKLLKASKWLLVREILFLKYGEGIHGIVGKGGFRKDKVSYSGGNDVTTQTNIPKRSQKELTIGNLVFEELLKPDDNSLNPDPILIDIKHMDIKARLDYYKIREKILAENPNRKIPIIASHMAVSGESLAVAKATGLNPLYDRYEEIEDPQAFYRNQKEKPGLADFWRRWTKYHENIEYNPFDSFDSNVAGWFYPWSINLANEEISMIHDSEGIIGLMLDGRQLGAGMKNYNNEHLTMIRSEFPILSKSPVNQSVNLNVDEYIEVEPFLRNLVYIVEKCDKTKTPCWNHVALGSDFDGLIDPMKICPTASYIPDFRKKIENYLSIYLRMNNKEQILNNMKGDNFNQKIQNSIEKVFFSNGKEFVLNSY